MAAHRSEARARLAHRLAWQQVLHDGTQDPRNHLAVLPGLRRFQQRRLALSFRDFLERPSTRPAATFFLEDLYGDKDHSGRDRDVARVAPMMARLLPAGLVLALAQAVELGALSHAFDLRVAEALHDAGVGPESIDLAAYGTAYRAAGLPRLRRHQIHLIVEVGRTLDRAVHTMGVARMLRLSRVPARAAGVMGLQAFLERGFEAFRALEGADGFLRAISERETAASARLFEGAGEPFGPRVQPNSRSR